MTGADFTIGPIVGRYRDDGVLLKWAEQGWHQARPLTSLQMLELGVALTAEAENERIRRLSADGDILIDRERA